LMLAVTKKLNLPIRKNYHLPESVKVLHVSKVSTIGGEFTPKYEVVLVKY
jgi:hypothetical protein